MITTVKTSSVVQGMPKYRSMLAGNPAYIPSSFESIATITASGSQSTITFSSIPSTYTHLQIRGIAYDSFGYELGIRFNSDTASNYSYHSLYGDGSAASATFAANATEMLLAVAGNANNYMATFVIDILDYGSTTKNKTCRSFSGYDNNTSGELRVRSGLWRSTSAVNSITIFDNGSKNYSTSTTFALYGIKAA